MTDLQIIGEIVTNYSTKKVDLLNVNSNESPENNLFLKAFQQLSKDPPDDDRAGDYLIYPRGTTGFRKFLSRFREKLLNSLFFIQIDRTRLSEAKKAEYRCSRMQHIIRILAMLYGRRPAMKLGDKMLTYAEKFQLAEYAVFCAGLLRTYASDTGDKKAFTDYSVKYLHWKGIWAAEEKAKMCLEKINVHFGRSISQKPELSAEALGYVKEIKKDIAVHESFILQYHMLKLEALGYQMAYNYVKSLEKWSELENYIRKNPDFASDTRYAEIALHRMGCYMHLREYNHGKQCAETCMRYFWPGSSNRLIFMEYYYLLAMQCGEYKNAGGILDETDRDRRLNDMPETSREKWKLFRAYYFYVNGLQKNNRSFNISKFMNEFSVLNMDKRGINIAILILKWCMLIRMGEFDKLYEIAIPLKEYKLRNLKGKPNYRVSVFVNMLLNADRNEYDSQRVIRANGALYKKLCAAPITYSGNAEGIEIIPLDILWGLVINDMQKWKNRQRLKKS